ncbi:MAG: hypothetical protein AAF598_03975, partial [Bacteroidota bacterium]
MIARILHSTLFTILLAGSLIGQNNHELMVQGELYITEGAEIFVKGDVHIETSTAKLANSGKLSITGNLTKINQGQMQSNFQGLGSGKVIFERKGGPIEEQFIEGDFTLDESFYDLVINNKGINNPVVYLKNGNVGVANVLTFLDGRIRTGDLNSSTLYQTLILYSGDPSAIQGSIPGNGH